jgi:hypothetical protein
MKVACEVFSRSRGWAPLGKMTLHKNLAYIYSYMGRHIVKLAAKDMFLTDRLFLSTSKAVN